MAQQIVIEVPGTKISELEKTSSVSRGDVAPVVQGEETKQADIGQISDFVKSELGTAALKNESDFATPAAVAESSLASQMRDDAQNERIDNVEHGLVSIGSGADASFSTYAEMIAYVPPKANVSVRNNDPDPELRGVYTWTGTQYVDGYDPLEAAIDYTDDQVIEVIQNLNQKIGQQRSKLRQAIVVDKKLRSPLWLVRGLLAFAGLEGKTLERVLGQLGLGWLVSSKYVFLCIDRKGKSPLWLENGLFNCAGVHPHVVKLIKDQFGEIDAPKTNNVNKAAYPIVSDGASLTQLKSKIANLKSGQTSQLRVGVIGDSWAEHNTITQALADLLRSEYGEAGSGWINVGAESNQLDSIQAVKTGTWAYRDLDQTTTFPDGSGPDGFILTSTAAGNTIKLSNLTKGDKLTIFFGKKDGSFKYSVNAGAEVVVNSSATGTDVQSALVTLTDATSELLLTTISGTVVIYGFHLRKSTGSGVEVTKLGNGSCTGRDYLKISPTAQMNFSDYLKFDVIVNFLGTNDYRKGHSVEEYKAGISACIDGYRTNNPNCGVILVAPADSKATPIIPLTEFRDAVYEIAQAKQAEFYNMHDDWNLYDAEKLNGMWKDTLHVNEIGAYRLAKKLFNNFMEL
ncbi:GDSL-like Lipase/Acylhydrolase family protein [Acinetobacter baumannii 573719]|nr:GDSL-like Lipase/Acylhydrolase family protein [Acinetobacter baumannii 573719]